MKKKMELLRSRSRSQQMFEISVCPIVSAQYLLNRSNIFLLFTKRGMEGYYHEIMCYAEKLVHYLQCQGHSEDLYNQNMTIFSYIF